MSVTITKTEVASTKEIQAPPTISLQSPTLASDIERAATTLGITYLRDLPTPPTPFTKIQDLFNYLSAHPDVADALNSVYAKRGLYKTVGLRNEKVDQKVTLDLGPARLELVKNSGVELDMVFWEIVEWFEQVEKVVVSRLVNIIEAIIGSGPIHKTLQRNYRLADYFANPTTTSSPRCGSHRDYGTFTLVFPSDVPGLEYLPPGSMDNKYIRVASSESTILLFGWSAAILSNDRIKAASHRVVTPTMLAVPRRISAIVFVAPDEHVALVPVGEGSGEWNDRVKEGGVTAAMLKSHIGRKWRRREGTVCAEDVDLPWEDAFKTQDEAIDYYLRV